MLAPEAIRLAAVDDEAGIAGADAFGLATRSNRDYGGAGADRATEGKVGHH